MPVSLAHGTNGEKRKDPAEYSAGPISTTETA